MLHNIFNHNLYLNCAEKITYLTFVGLAEVRNRIYTVVLLLLLLLLQQQQTVHVELVGIPSTSTN